MVLDAEKVRPAFRIGDMMMDAESYRPLFEFAIRVVNDFRFTNMFFVRKCSLLIRENPRAPANEGIYRQSAWQPSASSHIGSIMSFEAEEEVHCRGRESVSAYPLICLTQSYDNLWKNPFARANVLKTLPELSKFVEPSCDSLCDSLFGLLRLSQLLALWLPFFSLLRGEVQVILQLEIYNLTSSERVKRGVKRAWLIGETLALETGSGQKQPNIHRTKYKGVRFRPSRSRTKPWTAEVKPPMEKNKVWIDDCNTPEAAAHAYDVAAFYYGKGNKALNFEHTPRFLPKILEYSWEEGRKRAIQEQVRYLRRNPLFYLIHQLPYQVLFFLVLCEFQDFAFSERVELAWLVVQLMRLVRKDGVATIFRLLDGDVLMNVHVPTNIPQLLERIDCIIKEILPQVLWHHKLRSPLIPLLNWFTSCLPQLKAQDPTKDILLTLHFIEWVRINLVTPQKSSTKAEDLPPIPTQCNTSSMISVEIDLRAPQTSSMAMEAEDPLVNIPPQCNTSFKHYPPHEQIQDTLEQDLIISHKFSLESQHSSYQDATPEERVVQSSIVEEAATIVLSTPVATIVETSLLHSPPFDVEIANEGFQTWDLCANIQVGPMSGHMTSTLGTSSNFHPPPLNCFNPLSIGAQTQSSTFMDSDARKDLTMPIPSSMEVGDCHPKCNNLVVPLPPTHEHTQDALKQDLRNLDELPLECEHLACLITSLKEDDDECIKISIDQAATEFMDLDDGEDLATLFKRLQHDQLGDIGDRVASVQATLMEGCNPDINDMVLTSVPGHIEGNEINSLCEYEHVMEPPHPFAFSQQPFVQFDEYL